MGSDEATLMAYEAYVTETEPLLKVAKYLQVFLTALRQTAVSTFFVLLKFYLLVWTGMKCVLCFLGGRKSDSSFTLS